MAPGYRNQNRRQNRTGYVDHNEYEGLPIRHWRRDYVMVAPPPTQENTTSQNDIWAVELPHGMPKDSHLLSQHSQDLLRAARSGRIYKRPPPVEEEEADPETIPGDKPEKKEDDPKDKGFTAKAWKLIPRHMEGPDVEYLAKRRKGLVTVASKATTTGPTLTKTTVRRTDAAGKEYVQDVIMPNGQPVEGEVISQTVIPDPKAAADGMLVHPAPSKRKGPPPRKKLKGPGRGRKKKPLPPTSVPQPMPADGVAPVEGTNGFAGSDIIKIEGESTPAPTSNEDTEMAEGSMAASDDDDGEDGEDGDEGDDDEGSLDNQGSPSKPPRSLSPALSALPNMKEMPSYSSMDSNMSGPDLPGPPLPLEKAEIKSGSPLKNIALTTSLLASPLVSPTTTQALFSITPSEEPVYVSATTEHVDLNEAMQQEAVAMASPTLPPPPPEPSLAEINAAVEVRQEEEEEEMLLDIIENTNNGDIGSYEISHIADPEPPTSPIPQTQEPEATEPIPSDLVPSEPVPSEPAVSQELSNVGASVQSPVIEAEAAPVEEDDDFPDLLGGLEAQLNEPQAPAAPAAAPVEVAHDVITKHASPVNPSEAEAAVASNVDEGPVEEIKETEEVP